MAIGLSFDADNEVHLAYRVIDPPTSSVGRLARETPEGWEMQEVGPDVEPWLAFVLRSTDEDHIVYSTEQKGGPAGAAVRHAVLTDGSWRITEVGTANSPHVVDAVADSNGRLHASYYQCFSVPTCYPRDNGVVVSTLNAGGWVEERVAASDEGAQVTPVASSQFLAAGPNEVLGLLLNERQHNHENTQTGGALAYWQKGPDGWRRDVIASAHGLVAYEGVLTFDATGEPIVAFVELVSPEPERCGKKDICSREPFPAPVVVARRGASAWYFEEVEIVSNPWVWGVAGDSSGAIVIVYRVEHGTARLATNACGTWAIANLDSSDIENAGLALDRDGRPAVAYFLANQLRGLYLAKLEERFAE